MQRCWEHFVALKYCRLDYAVLAKKYGATVFKAELMYYVNFLQLILSRCVIFSWIFPMCKRTAFKLSLDESMKDAILLVCEINSYELLVIFKYSAWTVDNFKSWIQSFSSELLNDTHTRNKSFLNGKNSSILVDSNTVGFLVSESTFSSCRRLDHTGKASESGTLMDIRWIFLKENTKILVWDKQAVIW